MYIVNNNLGDPDLPLLVLIMGVEKTRMAINMDREGKHYSRDKFCFFFFDGNRKWCWAFIILTASTYHPLLRKQVPMAIMETPAKNTQNVTLFWTLFNEVLQKVNKDSNYIFDQWGAVQIWLMPIWPQSTMFLEVKQFSA